MSSRLESSGRFQDLLTGLEEEETRIEHSGAYYLLHSNLRIFSRAIQCLSKLGSDLYLEPVPTGLSLKAFNKNKSVHAVFLFSNDFFSANNYEKLGSHKGNMICRISMKCALAIFKGIQFLDKNYAKYEMWVDPEGDVLVVQIIHAYDLKRTIEINVLETRQPFKTRLNKNQMENVTVAQAESLMSVLALLRSEDELVISATEDMFEFKNFSSNEETNKRVKTSAEVKMEHLTRHRVNKATEISFSIKDFMAALTFASLHQCAVSLYYDLPGMALVIALEGDVNHVAEFTIATFEGPGDECDEVRNIDTDEVIRRSQQAQSQNATVQAQDEDQLRNDPMNVTVNPATTEEHDLFDDYPIQPNASGMEMARERVSETNDTIQPIPPVAAENMEHDQLEVNHEPIDNNYMMDDSVMIPERQNEDVVMDESMLEPSPKRARDNDFRRFFLNANVGTQVTSQANDNQEILAYESEPE